MNLLNSLSLFGRTSQAIFGASQLNPRRIFRNDLHNQSLQSKGVVTLDLVPPAATNDLKQIIERLSGQVSPEDVHIKTSFTISAFHNDGEYKRKLYDQIYGYLRTTLDTLLESYVPMVINVFEKEPNTPYSHVNIHQNPSFVEEPFYKSVSVWIPLTDVNKENGTLGILPGSQDVFDAMRAPNMPDVFAESNDNLINHYFTPLNLVRGQAAILDDSVIHWSYPNLSNQKRTAVQLIMVPLEARHIYYFYDSSAPQPQMHLYDVDKEFFFRFNCQQQPEGLPYIASRPFTYTNYSDEELVRRVRAKNPALQRVKARV